MEERSLFHCNFEEYNGKRLSEVDNAYLQWRGKRLGKVLRNQRQASRSVQVLLSAIKTCSTQNLEKGKQLHAEVVECGHDCDVYVANALINMYAKCGSMVDACKVFDGMKCLTVVSWTALILGYAENGHGRTALDHFFTMLTEGHASDSVTLVAALKACTSLAVVEGASCFGECRDTAKGINSIAVEIGCNSDVYVQNCLMDMYAKCNSMVNAREVFDIMKYTDVVSWNVLISGYVRYGQGHTALDMFSRMKTEGVAPDCVTMVAAFKACISFAPKGWGECIDRGKKLQNFAVEIGCNLDACVQSTLVDMYAKCGRMVDAWEEFHSMKQPTLVSWNVLIFGYANNGQGCTALGMFTKMRIKGLTVDSVTVVAVLKACSSLAVEGGAARFTENGKQIHNFAVGMGFDSDVYVQSTLLDMYAKCGSMADARDVFDRMHYPDAVSWTVLILGYASNGQGDVALDFFIRIKTEAFARDSATMVAALKACSSLAVKETECMDRGKELHSIAVENDLSSDVYVQNTLIDMYANFHSMVEAWEIFNSMKSPDVVSWTALILGYVNNKEGQSALILFTRMRTEGPAPDSMTFGAALKACGLVGALDLGRKIHSELDSRGEHDVVLVNCLVDFYVKCGSLVEAESVFCLHAGTRDMVTWNALLAGYSSCGEFEAVFRLFEEMQDEGFRPDGITLQCILTCCSHSGLVLKGKECFDAMSTKYGVFPTIEHYTCMIDLLGRVNKLDDAMDLLRSMPCSPDDVTWRTILSACRKWENVGIGRLAFKSLIDLNDRDTAAYVLMGQIYGSKGMMQEQDLLMRLRKNFKEEEAVDVHSFLEEGSQHSQMHEIRERWGVRLKQPGDTFNSSNVTGDNSNPASHRKRLALVCALMKPGKTIRNVTACDECHGVILLNLRSKYYLQRCKSASCYATQECRLSRDFLAGPNGVS